MPTRVAVGVGDSRTAGRARRRAAPGRDTGQPVSAVGAAAGAQPTELAGGFGLPDALPLSGRIEESFRRRLEALPGDTQRLLLVAAAEPTGDPALLWRRPTGWGSPALRSSRRCRRRPDRDRRAGPVSPSAGALGGLPRGTPDERRRVEAALAEATDPRVDPDRRAWHLAAAATGPDESVAGELERAAGRAQARGGLAAAAAFLERAAALTRDPSAVRGGRWRRRRRSTRPARSTTPSRCSPPPTPPAATISSARVCTPARADRVRHPARRQRSRAPAEGRPRARGGRSRPRARHLSRSAEGGWFAGGLARGADVVEVGLAALGPAPRRPPRPTDLLRQGVATLLTEGHAAAAPILKTAVSAFRAEADLPPEESRWLSLACRAAGDVWDEESWRLLATRELQRAREVGALTATPMVLSALSYIHVLSGELWRPAALLDESERPSRRPGCRPIATARCGSRRYAGGGGATELAKLHRAMRRRGKRASRWPSPHRPTRSLQRPGSLRGGRRGSPRSCEVRPVPVARRARRRVGEAAARAGERRSRGARSNGSR